MEYLLTLYSNENAPRPAAGESGFDEMMASWFAFNQVLIDGGHWIAGASLAPTTTATTVRRTGPDAVTLVDGPYAETKEQLGGFYLFRADDLDQAIEVARKVPIPEGSFELRPVAFRPDSQG